MNLSKLIRSCISDVDPDLSYKDLADAVGEILIRDYGQHNFEPFINQLNNKLNMAKRPNIIIKDQKGNMSFHKNWTTASRAYGWNTKESRNISNALNKYGEFDGLTREYMKMEVSIPCQLLREFLQQGHTQKNNFNNELETQEVFFTIGVERQYVITASVTNTITVSEVATDADGHDLTHTDYSAEVEEILEVINEHGEVVKLDKATEKLLLEKLEL